MLSDHEVVHLAYNYHSSLVKLLARQKPYQCIVIKFSTMPVPINFQRTIAVTISQALASVLFKRVEHLFVYLEHFYIAY